MNAFTAYLALALYGVGVFALGYWVGHRLGVLTERKRTIRAFSAAKVQLLEAIGRFARNFPQDVTIQVVDKDGTIVAEGSTRPEKGERIH